MTALLTIPTRTLGFDYDIEIGHKNWLASMCLKTDDVHSMVVLG